LRSVIRGLSLLVGVALVGGAVAVACGGDDYGGSSGSGTQPTAAATSPPSGGGGTTLNVTISGSKYSPDRPTVSANQTLTVRIQNNDSVSHTFSIQNGASSGTIPGGSSGTATVNIPSGGGSIVFFCQIHGQGVMSGTIVYQAQ